MTDVLDVVPKAWRSLVVAIALIAAVVAATTGILSLIESKASAAANIAVAPLQVQVSQAQTKADQVAAGQEVIWTKLGGKIDQISEKIDTLANTVSGLSAIQAAHLNQRDPGK